MTTSATPMSLNSSLSTSFSVPALGGSNRSLQPDTAAADDDHLLAGLRQRDRAEFPVASSPRVD